MQGPVPVTGTLTEGDELTSGIGEFRKLERRLGRELAELGESLLGFACVTEQRGECHLGLLEVCGGSDRLDSHAHGSCATR